jgi:hypothetical protein
MKPHGNDPPKKKRKTKKEKVYDRETFNIDYGSKIG